MIGFLLGLLLVGLIAGFIARAVVPGKDDMSVPATILLGVVGSFVGGFLGSLLFGASFEVRPAGIIGSIIGANIVLLIYNRTVRRSELRADRRPGV